MKNLPSLWSYSGEVYANPKVADWCLAQQTTQQVSVPLVLFACWSGQYLGTLDKGLLIQAKQLTKPYDEQCITPLRHIRSTMKAHANQRHDEWQRLRAKVKQLELESEKLLLNLLESSVVHLPVVDGHDQSEKHMINNLQGLYSVYQRDPSLVTPLLRWII